MNKTIAQCFREDARVLNARHELLKLVAEYQNRITDICPPRDSLKVLYDELIKSFNSMRGAPLFYNFLGSGIGKGALVELADGSIKYDFALGIGVHFFGHSHPEILSAALDAALSDTIMQGNLQQNTESCEMTKTLLAMANKNGANFNNCFLTSTGVMGGENALKMALQKKSPAKRLLCFKKCFMGRTLVMAQTTDNASYREGLPQFVDVDYVPFFDSARPKQSTEEAVKVLNGYLSAHPNEYAAMCFELVLGEGGFYPGSRDFFEPLMKILKQKDIPVLVDEVQSFARTTEPFSFQLFKLDEYIDAVWIGKASQVCATLFNDKLKPKQGLLGQTYTASTTAIMAGLTLIKSLLNNGYYGPQGKIAVLQDYCHKKLKALEAQYPEHIQGPYGIGAMLAFTPFGGDAQKVKGFLKKLFDEGLIAFYCGDKPTRVRMLIPAGAVTEHDLDRAFEILKNTFVNFIKTAG